MTELWQHVAVTLVAIVAAGVLVRQVVAFISPSRDGAACSNCATGKTKRRRAAGSQPGPAPVIQIQIPKKR